MIKQDTVVEEKQLTKDSVMKKSSLTRKVNQSKLTRSLTLPSAVIEIAKKSAGEPDTYDMTELFVFENPGKESELLAVTTPYCMTWYDLDQFYKRHKNDKHIVFPSSNIQIIDEAKCNMIELFE